MSRLIRRAFTSRELAAVMIQAAMRARAMDGASLAGQVDAALEELHTRRAWFCRLVETKAGTQQRQLPVPRKRRSVDASPV